MYYVYDKADNLFDCQHGIISMFVLVDFGSMLRFIFFKFVTMYRALVKINEPDLESNVWVLSVETDSYYNVCSAVYEYMKEFMYSYEIISMCKTNINIIFEDINLN